MPRTRLLRSYRGPGTIRELPDGDPVDVDFDLEVVQEVLNDGRGGTIDGLLDTRGTARTTAVGFMPGNVEITIRGVTVTALCTNASGSFGAHGQGTLIEFAGFDPAVVPED
jgi:hypothetical protein